MVRLLDHVWQGERERTPWREKLPARQRSRHPREDFCSSLSDPPLDCNVDRARRPSTVRPLGSERSVGLLVSSSRVLRLCGSIRGQGEPMVRDLALFDE